jgi:branched-chain amino acid transport system substrate-binding protein
MSRVVFKITFLLSLIMASNSFAEINVAIIAPVSGVNKTYGSELAGGARVAIDEINEEGGLIGKKVNLIVIDDPCDDVLSLTTAQMTTMNKINQQKVALVIGPYCSNSIDKVAETFAKSKIIQIIPTTISANMYKKSYNGLIKFAGFKEQQAKALFKYIQEQHPDKILAVVYDSTNPENVGVAEAIRQEYANAGEYDKLVAFSYGVYAGDGNRIVNTILDEKIEIAYVMGEPYDIMSLSKMLRDEKSDFLIFSDKYQLKDDYKKVMEYENEGDFIISLPSLKDNPNFAEVLVKLRLLGVEPEGLMVYSYLSIRLWKEAAEKSNSFEYDKISDTLNNHLIQTGWANVEFLDGNPDKSVDYCIHTFKDSEYTQVY